MRALRRCVHEKAGWRRTFCKNLKIRFCREARFGGEHTRTRARGRSARGVRHTVQGERADTSDWRCARAGTPRAQSRARWWRVNTHDRLRHDLLHFGRHGCRPRAATVRPRCCCLRSVRRFSPSLPHVAEHAKAPQTCRLSRAAWLRHFSPQCRASRRRRPRRTTRSRRRATRATSTASSRVSFQTIHQPPPARVGPVRRSSARVLSASRASRLASQASQRMSTCRSTSSAT